ncbi:protein Wnt-11b-like isoform X2 [Colius striatus]|uniref:protein Wnt-11b-like isoform X2 n=1 Tax=Colius striatus TaxID=57412 RepID=UPI002B1CF832|nr:protein Wnt-11b-like isoform X2 [Colius striatus]
MAPKAPLFPSPRGRVALPAAIRGAAVPSGPAPIAVRAMGRAPAAAVFLCQLGLAAALQWLGLAESGGGVRWNESQHCRLLAALLPDQLQVCRRNLEVMHSIVRAARLTKSVCQKTFADMRWNCSSIQRAPSFGPDLLKGTREAAFVHALAAAAVPHAIARACASGELPLCSCGAGPGEPPGPGSRWGGCGDNLRYGLQLGAAFADSALKSSKAGTQALQAMNLHNNAAGRQVLSDSLATKCKCHGVSGSCSVKTCWKGLPGLEEIASDLKSKYLAAVKVTHRLVGLRKQLIPKEMDTGTVRETDLVYLINSPDYCAPNAQLGSLGTQDRHCNKSSVGSDSCDLLCCGRGYNSYTEEVLERCQCRYRWCCYVACKRCWHKVDRGKQQPGALCSI